jgi:hypothetical protein
LKICPAGVSRQALVKKSLVKLKVARREISSTYPKKVAYRCYRGVCVLWNPVAFQLLVGSEIGKLDSTERKKLESASVSAPLHRTDEYLMPGISVI